MFNVYYVIIYLRLPITGVSNVKIFRSKVTAPQFHTHKLITLLSKALINYKKNLIYTYYFPRYFCYFWKYDTVVY